MEMKIVIQLAALAIVTIEGKYTIHYIILHGPFITAQAIPAEFTFPTPTSVNGSSATGNCASVSSSTSGTLTCADPTSSVLFDGIPVLTGLDGDTWASQLLTVHTRAYGNDIIFDFHDTPGSTFRVERIELTMFNCPQWGTGAHSIIVLEQGHAIAVTDVNTTSCDSLVRVCISPKTTARVLTLRLFLYSGSDWAHLAEVTFWGNNPICPPEAIITVPLTDPEATGN